METPTSQGAVSTEDIGALLSASTKLRAVILKFHAGKLAGGIDLYHCLFYLYDRCVDALGKCQVPVTEAILMHEIPQFVLGTAVAQGWLPAKLDYRPRGELLYLLGPGARFGYQKALMRVLEPRIAHWRANILLATIKGKQPADGPPRDAFQEDMGHDATTETEPDVRQAGSGAGRKADANRNRDIARVVGQFGDAWKDKLGDVCERLDADNVSLVDSKKWRGRNCEGWLDVYDVDKEGLRKALQHRLEWVRSNPSEN